MAEDAEYQFLPTRTAPKKNNFTKTKVNIREKLDILNDAKNLQRRKTVSSLEAFDTLKLAQKYEPSLELKAIDQNESFEDIHPYIQEEPLRDNNKLVHPRNYLELT